MDHFGFIHEKMDIKILILYVLEQLPGPVDALTLSDLVFCDDGIGYFDYSDCLAELTETGQITEENNAYAITEAGRRNVEAVGDSIPYSVRAKARRVTEPLAERMRRAAMIKAKHQKQEDGTVLVELGVTDGISDLLDMKIMAPAEKMAEAMEQTFRTHAERIYHEVIRILTESEASK
jgi:hypothetical protein